MAITTALLLLAALPESGTTVHARATAHILAAEEIDFTRPDARPEGVLLRIVRRRDTDGTASPDAEGAEQLVEFQ
ncbi:hypothetical protein [Parasphingopyxis lamellibrachiae]|uniref:Uncharacterized protein n=1 Tax=Parasphingopyxis lamellibrachiae TaxID=680125 RepID=A0A3D9FH55_9SPHN|nr:hypothetical protein [Parasphingopyxis lamellibrachiae]RED17120.1 hypothetical protein DFR46_2157 [Parasphingopyxis lamellibrachiae]